MNVGNRYLVRDLNLGYIEVIVLEYVQDSFNILQEFIKLKYLSGKESGQVDWVRYKDIVEVTQLPPLKECPKSCNLFK